MCGLAGIYGPTLSAKDMNMFQDLLMISQIRGRQGAGFYKSDGKTYRHERRENATKLIDDFSLTLGKIDGAHIAMGHARWPTVGDTNIENCHPFVLENIVGAHNGTLEDVCYRDDESKSDSEWMFRDIDNDPDTEQSLVRVLEKLNYNSAYAISVYNHYTHTLFLSRNTGRPLHLAYTMGGNVVWASEYDFIEFASRRAGVKLSQVFRVEEDTILRFELGDMKPGNFKASKKVTIPYSKNMNDSIIDQKFMKLSQFSDVDVTDTGALTWDKKSQKYGYSVWNNSTGKYEFVPAENYN